MVSALDDLLSRDGHRIWQASWDIIRTRDTAVLETLRAALPEIRRATADVELGGMIRPNRDTLNHALAKIEGYSRWKCWCDDYPRLLQYDPHDEEERGHARTLSHDSSFWPGVYESVCAVCGKRFTVQGGEHHSVWWKWTPAGVSSD